MSNPSIAEQIAVLAQEESEQRQQNERHEIMRHDLETHKLKIRQLTQQVNSWRAFAQARAFPLLILPADGQNGEVEKPADYGVAPVRVLYTNHHGDTRIREIVPQRFWLGVSPYHNGTQYFLTALDVEKKEMRDFALTGIKAWLDDIR